MINTAEITLQLALSGEFTVIRAEIDEGISEHTNARVDIAAPKDLMLGGTLEADAVLTLELEYEPVRSWTLRVNHIEYLGDRRGSYIYRVHLRPEFYFLHYTTSTRKFRNMSSKDIIAKVLDDHHVKHEWQLTRDPDKRKYCAQYRETNLAFISRLLEFEGIFFSFADDGTLIFGDHSPSAPPIKGKVVQDLIESAGAMTWAETGVFRIAKGREVASGAATVNDYSWKTPSTKLLKSSTAEDDAELEIYDYPVGYRRPDQGARLAQQRLEAYRVPGDFLEGEGNVEGFAPRTVFTFSGNAQPRFAGEYLLQRVSHEFCNMEFIQQLGMGGEGDTAVSNDGSSEEQQTGYSYRNRFHSIPKDVKFRPPLLTPHPEVEGCHTAMVRGPDQEEIHTDSHGRQKVQFHWDRDAVGSDEDSRWVRNNQEITTGMVLARVGWEQSMAYISGDPDRPITFARNINGIMMSEYGQPNNKTRMTIKTPSYPAYGGYNELRLEDGAGDMHFDWHAQKDWLHNVERDRVENVANDHTHRVGRNMSHTVGNDQQHSIGGNLTMDIGTDCPLIVQGNREFSVGGNEETECGAAMTAACQANDTEDVGGNKKTTAGKDEEGSISRAIVETFKWTIGGDCKQEAEGNIQTVIQKDFTETIGGSKIVKCAEGGIGGTVVGKMTRDITGNTVRKSEKGMGYSAKNSKLEITGITKFISDEQLTVRGNDIMFEATRQIKLVSNGLEIKLTHGEVAVKGHLKLKSGSYIRATGNKNNITD